MPLDLSQNRGPIDEMDQTFRDVLEDLQGNILTGHGRYHAVHFVLHFNPERIESVKRWISNFANQHITSAWAQIEQAIAYREHGIDAGVFGHLALSAAGYRALGIPEERIPKAADPQRLQLRRRPHRGDLPLPRPYPQEQPTPRVGQEGWPLRPVG